MIDSPTESGEAMKGIRHCRGSSCAETHEPAATRQKFAGLVCEIRLEDVGAVGGQARQGNGGSRDELDEREAEGLQLLLAKAGVLPETSRSTRYWPRGRSV